ncbi:hypothetical protein VD0002_g8792 [Verticillium dahliae]|uniref:25S rRNA (uridine-N(3))-methyltransferase BMT5-like domain-containing protein n=1 Tax=Verticillium dahliae TaxID=27337 RepID=A0A2J8F0E3_VERDA|nr:GDP-mannose transporter [Verticillium dahliae VDG2]PNH32269.1 hypothetical protein BJF96_g4522 [Verticillium dahliae]PNH38902.1 hypothetical protein VD0004_g7961 [Verticillium dahliae]PNH53047.1 hypothetical protein VD0003_g4336 [Verticillium dahliae]PNH58744.1 hypothetical protein VD0002_g8792 [Verticillium dahliae]
MAKRRVGSNFPDAPSRSKKLKHSAPPPPKHPKNKTASKQKQQKQQKHQQQHQNQKPVLPFRPHDAILLVGEGDLGFAASLAAHHGCTNLTATVLEKNEAELLEKYPHASEHIAKILAPNTAQPPPDSDNNNNNNNNGSEGEDEEDYDSDGNPLPAAPQPPPTTNRILYNTDATALRPFTAKVDHGPRTLLAGKVGAFAHIVFNFPHVGGRSTDQNRQVRHNQALLVAFFARALPSLAPGGRVTVTLFEGEPYTLWNVRDLARHAGLDVDTSFRFPWAAYPGYRHARTLGVVKARGGARRGEHGDEGGAQQQEQEQEEGEGEGEGDEEEEDGREGRGPLQARRKGESKTAWKGEERAARSFVFKRKEEAAGDAAGKNKNKQKQKPEAEAGGKKKRHKIDVSDSDSDSDE